MSAGHEAEVHDAQADKYATSGVHSYATAEQLAWSNRGPRIIEELLGYDADVICLQEVSTVEIECPWGARRMMVHDAARCLAAAVHPPKPMHMSHVCRWNGRCSSSSCCRRLRGMRGCITAGEPVYT